MSNENLYKSELNVNNNVIIVNAGIHEYDVIDKVYLYDDKLTIIFKSQNKPYKEKMMFV